MAKNPYLEINRYNFPTEIYFGPGSRHKMGALLNARGLKRAVLVTDSGLAKAPFIQELVSEVKQAGLHVSVFADFAGNPVKSQVTAGAEACRKADCDSIIAVGGGAALDVAKAVAVMIKHTGDLFDYEDRDGAKPIDGIKIPYIVAIPTTAGTGSEVGRSTVISDDKTHAKKIIFSPALMPKIVFADPELTLGLPPKVTATTGMDALTHLIEAYITGGGFSPLCDGIALEGLHLLSESLEKCVEFAKSGEKSPEHIVARGKMLNAALMGAVAFQKGLGVTHSCAHALSTVYDMHHGLANGVMLPYAMRFNFDSVPEKFKRMAQAVGVESKTGREFIDWIERLQKKIGIPAKLSELGVSQEKLNALLEVATQDACHPYNPKPVTRADFEAIYKAAI